MREIKGDMSFTEVIRAYPEVVEVFERFGLDCPCCQMAEYENIQQGAKTHHVDLKDLLDAVNQKITNKSKS